MNIIKNFLIKANTFPYMLMLVLLCAQTSLSQEQRPEQVYVGIYLNQITSMSLKDNQYVADFYIWFRWKDKDLNPLESFDVVNGHIESKEGVYHDKVNGFNYGACRVIATIKKFWDISRFPLDNHTLTIEIEDNDNEEFKLKYVPDTENSGTDPQVQVPGWKLGTTNAIVSAHTYKTNYGDISLPTNNASIYSRFIFSVNIIRPGYGYFFKLFFTVFVAALVALIALFIKPTDLDPRFGLGAGALFAAVASEVVIASLLPDTNIMTLTDKLHIISIFFIFLSIAESIVSLKLFASGKEEASRRLDRICFYIFLVVYVVLNLAIIFS
ncbi:MAG: hypothetical protein ABIL20_06020 [candidate division WOR-3 bacterium]